MGIVQSMQITLDTAAVAAVFGMVTGIVGTMVIAWTRVVRPIQRIAEDWRGEPARPADGVPERPGMMLRMATQERLSQAIWAELHPNHGSSMKDQLTRVDVNLAAHVASHVNAPTVLTAVIPSGSIAAAPAMPSDNHQSSGEQAA